MYLERTREGAAGKLSANGQPRAGRRVGWGLCPSWWAVPGSLTSSPMSEQRGDFEVLPPNRAETAPIKRAAAAGRLESVSARR